MRELLDYYDHWRRDKIYVLEKNVTATRRARWHLLTCKACNFRNSSAQGQLYGIWREKRLKHGAANFQWVLFSLLASVIAFQIGEVYSKVMILTGKPRYLAVHNPTNRLEHLNDSGHQSGKNATVTHYCYITKISAAKTCSVITFTESKYCVCYVCFM
jgi:hypothetical protein